MKKSKERKKLKKLKFKALKLVFWHFVAIEKALKFYVNQHLDKDPDRPQNLDIKTAKWDFNNNFEAFSDNQELILSYIKKKAQKIANKHKYKELK